MIYNIFNSLILRKNVFDSDGSSVIADNSTNDQIWSGEELFTDKIEPIIYNGVAIIGGKDIITKGIGIVRWSWTDDEGKIYTKELNNVP